MKVRNFFAIKNHEKLSFFMLGIMGRVRIRGKPPKTTLKHVATNKYRETYRSM